jgi:hypothetical protein
MKQSVDKSPTRFGSAQANGRKNGFPEMKQLGDEPPASSGSMLCRIADIPPQKFGIEWPYY